MDWLGVDRALEDTSTLQPDEKFYVCMIAVDESTPENGCPAVAPGHHLHGLYNHSRAESFEFDDERAPNDEEQWLPCPLQRGNSAVEPQHASCKAGRDTLHCNM